MHNTDVQLHFNLANAGFQTIKLLKCEGKS